MTTRQAGGIALVLVVMSMFLTVMFRSIELVQERRSLHAQRDLQDAAVRVAAEQRRRFAALAAGVAELAAAGDSSARAIVAEMQREGVALAAPKH